MIHTFLKYLETNKIDYVITNGYKELFENSTSEHDVDILFKRKDFVSIEKTMEAFCKQEDFKIVQIYHQEVYAKNIFLYKPSTQEILNLDMYGKLHKNNYEYFLEETMFKNRISYKGISVLANHQEFFHYFLKKISKGDLAKITFEYLRTLYFKDESGCSETLKNQLNKTGKIIGEAFVKNDINTIIELRNEILADVKTRKPSFSYLLKDKLRVVKRILKPTGISIAFLGPDGSGKTTIIDGLKNSILPFRKTDYFHLKPVRSKNMESGVTTDPHQFKPYSRLKSYTKLLYFIYQYNFGWVKNIIPLKIKSSLIIFDRYFDDLIADNKRYRYGGENFMAKFFRLFIKKPSLYFVLVTDAKTIYQRKQEVAFTELESQIFKYRSLVDNQRYFEIDVKESPNTIVKNVFRILMQKMNERY
jgi:thymidylate kinase